MALPDATPHPTPQVVGGAFVYQYYQVLHHSPELVHRFYQDSSMLCHPDSEGVMTSVTTLQGINEKILSFNFSSYTTELETVDSASSYNGGVLIAVIGCLTGSDNIRRKFTQLFFLAPQENGGYFVLNDILRFIDNSHSKESIQVLSTEPELVQENHVEELSTPPEMDVADCEEVVHQSENDCARVEDEVAADPPNHSNQPGVQPDQETTTFVAQDNGPKKSYASIVKVVGSTPAKMNPSAIKDTASSSTAMNSSKPSNGSAGHATSPVSKVPGKNGSKEDSHDEEGYSIYIRSLPLHTTIEQVKEEVKKFGPIKPSGIQVRNHKVDPFCFGFVEFESLNSMQAAIKASHIFIGSRKAYIEEKKTSTRVINGVVFGSNNGRGRFPSGRGGHYRNGNLRGNDNFSERENLRGNDNFRWNDNDNFRGNNNQGYGRTDFRRRGEFSGRGRGDNGQLGGERFNGYNNNTRGGGGYHQQRPFQNGNAARMVRPVQTAVTA